MGLLLLNGASKPLAWHHMQKRIYTWLFDMKDLMPLVGILMMYSSSHVNLYWLFFPVRPHPDFRPLMYSLLMSPQETPLAGPGTLAMRTLRGLGRA
ncbi:hypothetical protein C6366_18120 [Desulfonatronum sp. SC1]|nr:hypothetical protein C6366_18120 [Desulfonatronum sp. SC1]